MRPMASSSSSASSWTRLATTLFACGWGISSSCLFFRALIVRQDAVLSLAALVSLVIVWAALERKRWGRQALLGLCAIALVMFIASLLPNIARIARDVGLPTPNLAFRIQAALECYTQSTINEFAVGLLSIATGIWLIYKPVVAEFEQGKRIHLAPAQRTIALVLVAIWALALLLMPRVFDSSFGNRALTSGVEQAPEQAALRSR